MEKRFLFAEVKAIKENEELGGFEAIANSGKKDRMGDIVDAQGWELGNFKKNPVMLWSHNPNVPPVARADKVWIDEKGLQVKGTWSPTPFAQELRTLFENGFLNALSVGFIPLEMQPNKENGFNISKQELYEISWVGIPADPRALATSRKALEFAKEKGFALISKELETEIAQQEAQNAETAPADDQKPAEQPPVEPEKPADTPPNVDKPATDEQKPDNPENDKPATESPAETPQNEPNAELEQRVLNLEKQIGDILGAMPDIASKVADNGNTKADNKADRLRILRLISKAINKEIVKTKQEK